MAFPHPPGLQPSEVAFLCEMELVTIVPRQRLERLDLLGGPTNVLIPPQRTTLPLWLALLLKRQRRINILPPSWLEPDNLRDILDLETRHFQESFLPPPPLPPLPGQAGGLHNIDSHNNFALSGPYRHDRNATVVLARKTDYNGRAYFTSTPFLQSCTASSSPAALPYHWFEFAEMLLHDAADDVVQPDTIRGLLRDLREVRLSKMRKGVDVLSGEGDGVRLDGVGAMEVAESRGFVTGVVDGLRKMGASREQARLEREEEERENRRGRGGGGQYDDDEEEEDEDMT